MKNNIIKSLVLVCGLTFISTLGFAQEIGQNLSELQAKIQRLESTIARVKQRYMLADSTLVLPVSENEIELQKLKLEEYNLLNRQAKGSSASVNSEMIPFLYIKKSELDLLPETKRNYIITSPSLYRVIENQ